MSDDKKGWLERLLSPFSRSKIEPTVDDPQPTIPPDHSAQGQDTIISSEYVPGSDSTNDEDAEATAEMDMSYLGATGTTKPAEATIEMDAPDLGFTGEFNRPEATDGSGELAATVIENQSGPGATGTFDPHNPFGPADNRDARESRTPKEKPRTLEEDIGLIQGIDSNYTDVKFLAKGGMGVVYKVHNSEADRWVAIKLIRTDIQGSSMSQTNALENFKKEAQALARCQGKGVLELYRFGDHKGVYYMVNPLIKAGSLENILSPGDALQPQEAVNLTINILKALGDVHSQNIVHRDLKPDNIYIERIIKEKDRTPAVERLVELRESYSEDEAMQILEKERFSKKKIKRALKTFKETETQILLADFGLARNFLGQLKPDEVGAIAGTPYYMSPEQARGDNANVNERSDIYAVGAMLYRLLTGREQYTADSMMEIIRSIVESPTPNPRGNTKKVENKQVSNDLAAITMKMMAKDPEKRYTSARKAAADLQRYLDWEPVDARNEGKITRGAKHARSKWKPLLGVATGIAVAIIGGKFLGVKATQYNLENHVNEAKRHALEFTASVTPRTEDVQFNEGYKLLQLASENAEKLQVLAPKEAEGILEEIEQERKSLVNLQLDGIQSLYTSLQEAQYEELRQPDAVASDKKKVEALYERAKKISDRDTENVRAASLSKTIEATIKRLGRSYTQSKKRVRREAVDQEVTTALEEVLTELGNVLISHKEFIEEYDSDLSKYKSAAKFPKEPSSLETDLSELSKRIENDFENLADFIKEDPESAKLGSQRTTLGRYAQEVASAIEDVDRRRKVIAQLKIYKEKFEAKRYGAAAEAIKLAHDVLPNKRLDALYKNARKHYVQLVRRREQQISRDFDVYTEFVTKKVTDKAMGDYLITKEKLAEEIQAKLEELGEKLKTPDSVELRLIELEEVYVTSIVERATRFEQDTYTALQDYLGKHPEIRFMAERKKGKAKFDAESKRRKNELMGLAGQGKLTPEKIREFRSTSDQRIERRYAEKEKKE